MYSRSKTQKTLVDEFVDNFVTPGKPPLKGRSNKEKSAQKPGNMSEREKEKSQGNMLQIDDELEKIRSDYG